MTQFDRVEPVLMVRDVSRALAFYAQLGFAIVPAEQLSTSLVAIVADETHRGLDPSRRVMMRRQSRQSTNNCP